MEKVKIKVVNKGSQELPEYADSLSSGMDLRANIARPITLMPLERSLITTGLHIQLPDGYEAQVRSRSGLSFKNGIAVVNGIGTIDASYTGDVGVPLINLSKQPFTIYPGDRIAQLVIMPIVQGEWVKVDKLDETERGDGGYGHTGIK